MLFMGANVFQVILLSHIHIVFVLPYICSLYLDFEMIAPTSCDILSVL